MSEESTTNYVAIEPPENAPPFDEGGWTTTSSSFSSPYCETWEDEMPIHSEELDQIAPALRAAQSEMKAAEKSASNPFHKSKYADGFEIWKTTNSVLAAHKLSISHPVAVINEKNYCITVLMHDSGQWMRSYDPIFKGAKDTVQEFGSGKTYAMRYGRVGLLSLPAAEKDRLGGMYDDDDDGEAAMGRKPSAPLKQNGSSNQPNEFNQARAKLEAHLKPHEDKVAEFQRLVKNVVGEEVWAKVNPKPTSLDGIKGETVIKIANSLNK